MRSSKKKARLPSSSAMTSEGFAPAKVNLTLHVTGQRADGYHLLDSLVVFADIGDRLWITPQAEMAIEVTGPFSAGVPTDARNLVWRAAALAGMPARISLEKNLPHGAGIGGGSSDAAAVLRCLGATVDATKLGADVPVCLTPQAQRMQGIGDQLTPVPHLPMVNAVLVNPGIHVATPQVFGALATKNNAPMPVDMPIGATPEALIEWLGRQRNDLEAAALSVAPDIQDALSALGACAGIGLARMSGSGSTCFGLFHDPKDASDAAASLARSNPGWWVRACQLR